MMKRPTMDECPCCGASLITLQHEKDMGGGWKKYTLTTNLDVVEPICGEQVFGCDGRLMIAVCEEIITIRKNSGGRAFDGEMQQ